MAMALGGTVRQKAEINVTPLIDVLLVLLIMFMVIQPPRSKGLKSLVPDEAADQHRSRPPTDVTLTVLQHQRVRFDREEVALIDLDQRLRSFLKRVPDPVIFVRGENGLNFGQVAEVIDIAKGAGIQRIGLLTD